MIQCDFVASRRSFLSKQVKMAASYCYCPSMPADVWPSVSWFAQNPGISLLSLILRNFNLREIYYTSHQSLCYSKSMH